VEPRQLGSDDAGRASPDSPAAEPDRRAVAVQQQASMLPDAEHVIDAVGRPSTATLITPARPLEGAVAALEERHRRFGRVSLERGHGARAARSPPRHVAESVHDGHKHSVRPLDECRSPDWRSREASVATPH